jgi:hypothetical protein
MNKPLLEKRYAYLVCLRNNGGRMTAAALAETMGKVTVTVWQNFHTLHSEGLVERCKDKAGAYKIQVTADGWAWRTPEPRPRVNMPKHLCGHPVVESTPHFCLVCRNARRWDRIEVDRRYYMPTMKQVMER